ncbi:hypothetical protein CN918_32235 [Priestia megaterium]|nr:hypothetical protein CN918_32235 [Priestia megaterium]
MNEILSSFLEQAAFVQKENQRLHDLSKLEIKRKEQEKNLKLLATQVSTVPCDTKSVASNRITELGFTILSCDKELRDIHSYTIAVDVYYCEYKEWRFIVEWHSDVDFEDGILLLKKATHKKSELELDVHCDLFCRSTSTQLLDKVKNIFENGYDTYIKQTYGHYLEIPSILREKGHDVKEHHFTFSLKESRGCLQVDEQVYLHVRPYEDSLMLFVTNFQHWSGKAAFELNKGKEISYPFSYKGTQDIEELRKCIRSLKEHLQGEFGYKEYSTQDSILPTHYNHHDFLRIFTSIKEAIKTSYFDYWNHYLVKYERAKHWGKDGVIDTSFSINHYKGLEIHETILFSLNDAAQWTIGEECIQYLIQFTYDKRVDDKHCLLKILQWIAPVKHSLSSAKFYIDETSPYCKGVYEQKGTYSDLTNELQKFLYENLSTQGIEI